MKQQITIDQLNELSEKGREHLREWWKPTPISECVSICKRLDGGEPIEPRILEVDKFIAKYKESHNGWANFYYYPLLSIGQMIEFLGDDYSRIVLVSYTTDFVRADDLCDALWEAVKEVLEH